ncbi:MAG: bifunctional phosphoribosylaminoimidazolecarboxamide formyltransferase/IMP cyclohydrolase [Armatimonadota bacterium]
MARVQTALISVSDKSGVRELAKGLVELGVRILSSGGTASHLRESGIAVTDVSDYTGFPEMMDGRVKTLHPKVHGGLLALRDNPEHMAAAQRHGITLIDMVVVNLYPFEQTIARPGIELAEAIENIDIGGPSMLRSAAKNYRSVTVICNPARYQKALEEMRASGGEVSDATRAELAVEAFSHTARYDMAIYNYLSVRSGGDAQLPGLFMQPYERLDQLRYGENPHQRAAFYRRAALQQTGLAAARQLHGKQLSFNNYLDLDTVLGFVREFDGPAAMIVKHNSPCGAAIAGTLAQAYRDALATDPLSAFGGVIGLNKKVDAETAEAILDGVTRYGFMECVLAPGYAPEALAALREEKRTKNLRLLELPELGGDDPWRIKQVSGGLLVQSPDSDSHPSQLKVATKRSPTAEEETALRFAWIVCKHTKSNAIVIARGSKAVGIGGGVTSRVDAAKLAVAKAGDRAKGAALASDAYFPFPDAIETAAGAGVTAIIQPGGSLNDEEAIAACDKHGVAMVFTGIRHFRH